MAGITGAFVALAGCDGFRRDGEAENPQPEGEQASTDSIVGGGIPGEEVDTYLSENNAQGYDGEIVDRTRQSTVIVTVGAGEKGLTLKPLAVHISSRTTIVWEWTSEDGGHNVVSSENSDITSIGEEDMNNQLYLSTDVRSANERCCG